MSKLLLALALGAATPALAGPWTSGGGELLRDTTNPWFLQNTPVVQACIVTDAEHFHIPPGTDLKKDFVEPVLAYWRNEFKGQPEPPPDIPGYPVAGTQTFQFGPCTDKTDVRFQFGVLTPEQLEGFGRLGQDPRNLVSIAVRTDYDPVTLRGKGFIYVAPDSGELRPASPDMQDRPWAAGAGGLLLRVLAHEMGHVFGVPHTTASPIAGDLMDPGYPEAAVSKQFSGPASVTDRVIPGFFTESDVLSVVGGCVPPGETLSDRIIAFLGAPAGLSCVFYQRNGDQVQIDGMVGSMPTSGTRVHLGTVQLAPERNLVEAEPVLRVWLPPQQKVVTLPGPMVIITGPRRTHWLEFAQYKSAAGGIQRTVLAQGGSGGGVDLLAIGADQKLYGFFDPQVPTSKRSAR